MIKIVLLALAMLVLVCPRLYNNQLTITEVRRSKGWLFLDRMAFDQGTVSVLLSLRLESETTPNRESIPLELAIIPDEMWMQEQTFRCDAQRQLGNSITVPLTMRKIEGYSVSVSHQIQINQAKNFHFVLRDCEKLLSTQYFRKDSKLIVRLEMINGDYHYGSDEHLLRFMFPMLLALTAVMIYFSRGSHVGIGEERDWAKFILLITLLFNFVALLFNYLGFLLYLWTGEYYGFFDFMYLLFHSISESVLTSLIIFIAYGWTITFTKDAEFDLYIPLVCMLGLINLILTLLGKINDGDSDKYHMYDTIPSYLLVFFRVCTVLIFAIGIGRLYWQNSKNGQVISFLANFAFMGAIYFLSLPAIMLVATVLPAASRKQIVFFSVECIKNTVNLMLTWMISSKNSKYKSIRQSSQSFFQAGNKLL